MRPICDLNEIKAIQIEILQKVHDYCEEKKIMYFLSHGSLIGAVRHKGFIPWDDDIDIFMPRDDYKKFCECFPNDQEKLGLEIVNADTKTYFGRPMSKVIDTRTILIEPNYLLDDNIGVNIDIWPLDGVPASVSEKNKRLKKIKLLIKLMYARIFRFRACRNIIEKIVHILSFPISAKSVVKRINKELCLVNFDSSEFVSCYVDPYKKEFKREWFKSRVLVPFEDKYFYIPGEADKVLSVLYGDYMKLPPIENQRPHHVTNVFWKD